MRLVTQGLEWNLNLLKGAAPYLDWVSVHGYWDAPSYAGDLSSYDTCMVGTTLIEKKILKAKHLLSVMGYLGKLRIAFDEWNLRGWYHPNMPGFTAEEIAVDKNDDNSSYTMADAVFSACFLNQCLKHANTVGMANFSPTVNTRGLLFTILRASSCARLISCLNSMLSTCRTRWLITGLTLATALPLATKVKHKLSPIST